MERVVLHSDLNAFYASAECLYHPEWRGKPLAVGGDAEARHGIILTKNQLAGKAGVRVGQAIWEAKQLCPGLAVVPPHFERYVRLSHQVRQIYEEYTDQVEPYGIDECWLDVTKSIKLFGSGKNIADEIRRRVRSETGLTVSIGVSYNKVISKLASDMKKPDATTLIPRDRMREIVWPLPVCDLLFVGWSATKKLRDRGIYTIGELAAIDPRILKPLGKAGEILRAYANGWDDSPVALAEHAPSIIKSVGNSTTCPRDLTTEDDAKVVLHLLAESVGQRMRQHGLMGSTVVVGFRDRNLGYFERQRPMRRSTAVSLEIANQAMELFRRSYDWRQPLRGLGLRVTALSPANAPEQCLLFDEERHQHWNSLEKAADRLRRRFGEQAVQRGILLTDRQLSQLDENIQSSLASYDQSH